MNPREEQVFHRLRVAIARDSGPKPHPHHHFLHSSSRESHHLVYNGISANNWLMPIGVTTPRGKSPGPDGSPLHDECHQALLERARSASLMLGRRQERQKQEARPVSVRGVKLGAGFVVNNSKSFLPPQSRPKESKLMRFSDRAVPLYLKDEKRRIQKELSELKRRPKTAPDSYKVKKDKGETTKLCDNLLVVQLAHKTADIAPRTITKPTMSERADPGEEFVNIFLDENNVGAFTSIREMSAAYRAYLESSPPLNEHLHVNTPSSSRMHSATSRASTRARSAHSGEETQPPRVPRNRFQSPERDSERPRSSWRPLLGQDGEHSDCTHRCRLCFSACLVPEEYMNNIEEGKTQQEKSPLMKMGNKNKVSCNNNKSTENLTGNRTGWGVYSRRKGVKAVLKEHPEMAPPDYNFGLSIQYRSYPENLASFRSLEDEEVEEGERASKIQTGATLMPTVHLSENIVTSSPERNRKNLRRVKTLGNISKGLLSKDKPVEDVGNLAVMGASVTDQLDVEEKIRSRSKFNMAQYRTFHRPGLLASIQSDSALRTMEELKIRGSPKPQHSRLDGPEDNSAEASNDQPECGSGNGEEFS